MERDPASSPGTGALVVLGPTVATPSKVPPMVRRSTWKPVSLVELSVQVRSISLVDTAVACRLDGALTGPPPPPPESLSWMVSVDLLRAASSEAPPVGLDRVSRTVSPGPGVGALRL